MTEQIAAWRISKTAPDGRVSWQELTASHTFAKQREEAGYIVEPLYAAPQALAATPAVGGERLALTDPAPAPCEDLSIGELIEWLDQPQYTNGALDSDAANHMSAAAELIERLVSSAPPEQPAADPVTDSEWQPIAAKPPFVECEERGLYQSEFGLFYFKATHWRPLPSASDKQPLRYGEPVWPGNENDDLDKGDDA